MTREQSINDFWNSFGIKAYDENTVPDSATLPYITYEYKDGDFWDEVSLTANLWMKGSSWKSISELKDKIGKALPHNDGVSLIMPGTPFSQRIADDTKDNIRRIVLNVTVTFLTA